MKSKRISLPICAIDEALWDAFYRADKTAVTATLLGGSVGRLTRWSLRDQFLTKPTPRFSADLKQHLMRN